MNIFFHADINALMDYHYYFKTGEFWRLPVRAAGELSASKDEQFIKLKDGFSYELCATVKKVIYLKENVDLLNLDGNVNAEKDEYGLVIFQMSKVANPSSMTLTFFIEFDEYDGISVEKKIKHFREGENYKGVVSFYLDCGCINTIVRGMWDNIENRSSNQLTPFSIFKIENIYNGGLSIQNIDMAKTDDFIIESKYVWQDELIGETLDYYKVKSKIDMVSLGDWKFGFMHLYQKEFPELIVQMGSKETFFTEIMWVNQVENIANQMSQGNFFDEYGDPWEMSFEEETLSFIKTDIPKSGWDDQYLNELSEVNILIRYTDDKTNNIATLTNLEEIQNFANWYVATYKKYQEILLKAKKRDYKYV